MRNILGIFRYKKLWIAYLSIFLLVSLIGGVNVHFDINNGLTQEDYEPVYHLLLRHFGIIKGERFARYSDSLEPINRQLPSTILSLFIGIVLLCVVINIVQLINRLRKSKAK